MDAMGYDPSGPNRSDEKSHKVPPMLASSRDIRSERMKNVGKGRSSIWVYYQLVYYWLTIGLLLIYNFTIGLLLLNWVHVQHQTVNLLQFYSTHQ